MQNEEIKVGFRERVLIPPRSTLEEDSLKSFCELAFFLKSAKSHDSVLTKLSGTYKVI